MDQRDGDQMNLRHVLVGITLSSQLLLLAPTASADTKNVAMTQNNLSLVTGPVLDVKDSTLTLTQGGTQITFTPSVSMSKQIFGDPDPSKHTFSFAINPIQLGGGTLGSLTLNSVSGSDFGLALGADGLEFTATMSATATVTPSAALDIATSYVLPGGFDIAINSATIFVNASLSAAGTSGGISFGTPQINAPFSVSNCTGVLINPVLATLPPFLPPLLPCDDIVTALINVNGGVSGPASDGLGTALANNWPTIISAIESGINAWANNALVQAGGSVPAANGHPWGAVQGTLFTEAQCGVGKSGQPCLAFEVARKTAAPPTCNIKPDSCDYGATFTCTGINADLGDKLQIYGSSQGKPWTLLTTQAGDAKGKAALHFQVFQPNGGANRIEKFSFWNFDPQNQANSAWDTEAQNQTVTLSGAWCHPSLCSTSAVCKLPNGKTFVPNVKNPDLCAQEGGKFVPVTKCTKPT
jgi:hypothetical protein